MSEAHFWFLLLLGMFAWPATAFIVRYSRYSPENIDITSATPELGWRTSKRLLIAAGSLLVIVGLVIFSFTQNASDFARSQLFLTLLLAGLAGFGGYSVVEGIRTRSVEPAIKGNFGPYSRADHPVRFWVSMAWNVFLTGLMVWLIFWI